MPQSSSEQSRAYQERAAQAQRQAEESDDPRLRAGFFSLADGWLSLARSCDAPEHANDAADTASTDGGTAAGEALLQEISSLLIREGDVAALYEEVLDGAIALMSADMGSMQTLDRERDALKLFASRGFHPDSAAFWQWVRSESESACAYAFASGARVIVADVEDWPSMAGTADLQEYRRSGIRAVQSTPLVSRAGRLIGMISTHWRRPHRPSERELGRLDVLARQAADLIERGQSEAALRRSEEQGRRLAAIVEFNNDAIISLDPVGIITSWNQGAERLYGHAADEMIGKPVFALIPPDRFGEEALILTRIKRGERVDAYDTVRRRKDGSLVEISLTISPLKDDAGRIIGASKISRDITERRRLERNVQLLSREVNHRARNLLTIVQAAVDLSNAETPQALKAVIAGRIGALARAHMLLAQARWAGADLGALIKQELAPFCSNQALQANVKGPDVQLTPGQAQAIAIVVHELATNAVKYGALSVATGRVRVIWTRAAEGLLLRWIERDGPATAPPQHRGFGLRAIEQIVRHQLGGDLRLEWWPDGLTCSITIPKVASAGETGGGA